MNWITTSFGGPRKWLDWMVLELLERGMIYLMGLDSWYPTNIFGLKIYFSALHFFFRPAGFGLTYQPGLIYSWNPNYMWMDFVKLYFVRHFCWCIGIMELLLIFWCLLKLVFFFFVECKRWKKVFVIFFFFCQKNMKFLRVSRHVTHLSG